MGSSKFIKTPKLGVVLQITEMAARDATTDRRWEIHDIERNRGFRVTLPLSTLAEPRAEREIEGAIGIAVERALLSPPEKVSGSMYDLEVASRDLRDFISLARP
jgi:hypothetical protein